MTLQPGDPKITECFELKETLNLILFQLPAMGKDTCHYHRFLQAPSNLAWETSRDGSATDALAGDFLDLHEPPEQPGLS